jgi:hypothetical protein
MGLRSRRIRREDFLKTVLERRVSENVSLTSLLRVYLRVVLYSFPPFPKEFREFVSRQYPHHVQRVGTGYRLLGHRVKNLYLHPKERGKRLRKLGSGDG